ncbi:MAG: MerR family transcriptional regulator [Acidimicrobiia bacterium]|nr:MerR family transcriptional regulator [Acidimicrobiia bacterium]
MKTTERLTVGSLARMAGVTVRTLHHYDEIGLVVPSGRTSAGYRTYGRAEVERLQEVLFFRELGFALDEIRQIVSRPGYSRTIALERQRELLEARTEHLLTLIDAVDRAVRAERTGTTMTNEEMLEVFGDFDPAEYEEEARERWGDSDAYKQSATRTARYTKQDWETIKAENDTIYARFLDLMAAGEAPDGDTAMDVAEEHRAHITKWYYDCSKVIHAGLGQMYVADVRFKENIDKAGEGLAEYMSAAIAANAGR